MCVKTAIFFTSLVFAAMATANDSIVTVDDLSSGYQPSYYVRESVVAPENHVIGIYEASGNHNSEGTALVHVSGTSSTRVNLVLSSYEATLWVLDGAGLAFIDAVIVNGYKVSRAAGIDASKVINKSGAGNYFAACAYAWPGDTGGCDTVGLVSGVERYFGAEISTFSGDYRATEFSIVLKPLPELPLLSQRIYFGTAPSVCANGSGIVTAAATSGLAVSYSTESRDCSVNAVTGVVEGIKAGAGNCVIKADQFGNSDYGPAAQVSQILSIGYAKQDIGTIEFSPDALPVGGTTTASAVATSGLPVSYGADPESICKIDAATGLLSGLAAGTCAVTASQAGDDRYSAATPLTRYITVNMSGATMNFATGWNLVGNGQESALAVPHLFGDAAKVVTVWKWVTSGADVGIKYPAWGFYTPWQVDGGQAYAAAHGFVFLTSIDAGEGFWVNAKTNFAVSLAVADAVKSASFTPAVTSSVVVGGQHALPGGWSLIATGDHPTPAIFNTVLATITCVPPPPGSHRLDENVTSLWAWDALKARWYFWAPSLINSGRLAGYLDAKGHLDFTTLPTDPAGTLAPTTGFWVNMP